MTGSSGVGSTGALGRAAATLAVLFSLSGSSAPAHAGEHRFEVQKPSASYPAQRQIRARFTARNTGATLLEGASFWTYVPARQTSTQRLLEVVSSHPGALTFDDLGNAVLEVELGRVAPHGAAVVTVTAVLGVSETPNAVKRKRARKAPDVELTPAPFVEADDPAIVELAGTLQRETPIETARAIHTWITRQVKDTGYAARDRGARWALDHKQGDCSEMAYLFVALARAAGLPARYLGGWVVEASALLAPDGFHNWAEFHDGTAWRVADAQKRIFDERPGRFVATNVSGTHTTNPLAGYHRFRSGLPALDVKMMGNR